MVLIRHAKSSWEHPVDDFDRPLSSQGIERAKQLSKMVADELDLENYHWFSSPANRAISTARIFQKHFDSQIKEDPKLYTFSLFELKDRVNSYLSDFDKIVIFGHNPAFTQFVNQFGNYELENLSTSGIVQIEFNTDQNQIQPHGKTTYILTHKKLFDAR